MVTLPIEVCLKWIKAPSKVKAEYPRSQKATLEYRSEPSPVLRPPPSPVLPPPQPVPLCLVSLSSNVLLIVKTCGPTKGAIGNKVQEPSSCIEGYHHIDHNVFNIYI